MSTTCFASSLSQVQNHETRGGTSLGFNVLRASARLALFKNLKQAFKLGLGSGHILIVSNGGPKHTFSMLEVGLTADYSRLKLELGSTLES